MKKNFTLCVANKELSKEEKMAKCMFGPREETLVLIRQFARIYRGEPKLEQDVCAYTLN